MTGMKKYLDRESKRIDFFEERRPMWLEYKEAKEKAKAQRRKTMAVGRCCVGFVKSLIEEMQQVYYDFNVTN